MASPRPGCGVQTERPCDGATESLRRRRIYNVVDDDPASRSEVSAFADALIAGQEPPGAVASKDGDKQELRLGLDEKRVRNARIKDELRVALRFPDYRAGLRALHAHDRTPFA